MKAPLTKALFLTILFSAVALLTSATHIMGGGITYRWLGTGNDYEIKLKLYRDCSGVPASSIMNIMVSSVSCSQSFVEPAGLLYEQEITPSCPAILTTCNGGTDFGITEVVYKDTVSLPMACTDWVFSLTDCCRNAAITTLNNPSSLNSYYYATLDNVNFPYNNSIEFANVPTLLLGINSNIQINNGAYDLDGDSISISLAPALVDPGIPAPYLPGYSPVNPLSSSTAIVVDPVTGDLTMTPSAFEVAVIVYKAEEYRNGILIGSVTRDMEVIVTNTSNTLPAVLSQPVVTLCAGYTLDATFLAQDMDPGDSTFFTTYSFDAPSASYSLTHSQGQYDTLHLVFTADSTLISSQPYLLKMKMRDNACPYYGIQYYTIRIYVTNCGTDVWPGDADADLTCDMYDVLPIGLAFGSTGPVRSGASINWVAQPGTIWGSTFISGLDYMHADCNGDGTIDWSDTLAISQNFGNTHPLRIGNPEPEILSIAPMQLVASEDSVGPNDTFSVEVRLGNSMFPVDDLYGIAFRIHFNAALVDSSLSHYGFINSWLGNPGSDLLTFQKPNWTDGYVDVVSVRNDQVDVGGDSTIGILEVVIIDNISARALNHFTVTGIRGITSQGEFVYFSQLGDSVIVNPSPVGMPDIEMIPDLFVYPNPVNEELTVIIHALTGGPVSVEIFNVLGKRIEGMQLQPVNGKQLTIDTSSIPSGSYLLKIQSEKGIQKKIFLVN